MQVAEVVVRVKWGRIPILGRLVSRLRRSVLQEVAQTAVRIMKEEAPVRTGRLRASIRAEIEDTEARIGPTVDYAKYVICWTRPSPGRYVPAIGKRLVNPRFFHAKSGKVLMRDIGMHPGTPANPFVEKTCEKLKQVLPRLLETEVKTWLQ